MLPWTKSQPDSLYQALRDLAGKDTYRGGARTGASREFCHHGEFISVPQKPIAGVKRQIVLLPGNNIYIKAYPSAVPPVHISAHLKC